MSKRKSQLEPEFITVAETAGLLQISRSTAYEAVRTGAIRSIRIGRLIRVPVAEIQRLKETQYV